MMTIYPRRRRDLCGAVAAALIAPGVWAQVAKDPTLPEGKVFATDAMPLRRMANGGESRQALRGVLLTGESVDVHESTLPVGSAPNPPHVSKHSEFILVQEGVLEYLHDGKLDQARPGDVIYVALGTLHTVRNAGASAVKYVVVALGGDVGR